MDKNPEDLLREQATAIYKDADPNEGRRKKTKKTKTTTKKGKKS